MAMNEHQEARSSPLYVHSCPGANQVLPGPTIDISTTRVAPGFGRMTTDAGEHAQPLQRMRRIAPETVFLGYKRASWATSYTRPRGQSRPPQSTVICHPAKSASADARTTEARLRAV